ncbi:MAG: M28 family peptidase, partial [Alloacidobacterium sp.]
MNFGCSSLTRLSRSAIAVSLLSAGLLHAQQTLPSGQPITTAPADPAIAGALQQVSPNNIRAIITKLVSFNNRSTHSSMDTDLAPGTGVSAAADWIESEFKRYSAACGGCLEVKRDDFIEPAGNGPSSRIKVPTKITNVYAILKGTDPAQADRRVLVTGHYDSRNSSDENTHDAAPGANDDASGTAVSIESARVLSKLKFPSTIVFLAVAGEEQGLNGSRHLARLAKSEGWDLEAVLNNDIVGGDTTPGATGADKSAVRVFSEG